MSALPEHGLVLGKFYPPHAGHHHLINVAAAGCQQLTVLVAAATVESIPGWRRARWIAQEHPEARVISCVDDVICDYDDPGIWDQHMKIFQAAVARPVDVVFTSEAYGQELARRLNAQHVLVDIDRRGFPVSGTAVREDPAAHWRLLPPATRAALTKRVVVLGSESTGTTTLSRQLADHYRTSWVGEYGREVSYDKQTAGTLDAWTQEDFLRIYLGQSRREEDAAREAGPVMIADTDPFATLIWEERYRGEASAEGRHLVALRPPPALYILTDHVGVAFEQDGIRDGEHLRAWMTARFEQELNAQPAPWIKVSGSRRQRLQQAVKAIDALLADGSRFADPLPQAARSSSSDLVSACPVRAQSASSISSTSNGAAGPATSKNASVG